MSDEKGNVSGTTEGALAADQILPPTTGSDGKWRAGIKGVLLECPLDIAWDLFSDWGNWGRRWQTASLVSELREGENRKPGCKRFVQYPEWFLTERILGIDNEKYFCLYNIEENEVLGGMEGYVAAIQFQESGDGKTMVESWKFEVEPIKNLTLESFSGYLDGVLRGILVELERGARRDAAARAALDPKPSLLNQTPAK